MNNLLNNLPWDVKSTITKVKNAVMNYTEMEAKVLEATNNDPWGASSTLLLEISRGTSSYQYFNEIMPMVYKRIHEPQQNGTPQKWRQVYKSLQLIDFLLKNGDRRVIDSVRDHCYDFKALSQSFKFVDEKGKDQGINVRHRAKEIVELVNDTERLSMERDKAAANRNKYTGVAADEVRSGSGGFGSASGGSRYGGFGSDSYRPSTGVAEYDSPAQGGSSSYGGAGGSYGNDSGGRKQSDPKPSIPIPQMSNNQSQSYSNQPQLSSESAVGVSSKQQQQQQQQQQQTANLLDLDFGGATSSAPQQYNQQANSTFGNPSFVQQTSRSVVSPQGSGVFNTQPVNQSFSQPQLNAGQFQNFGHPQQQQQQQQWNGTSSIMSQSSQSSVGLSQPANGGMSGANQMQINPNASSSNGFESFGSGFMQPPRVTSPMSQTSSVGGMGFTSQPAVPLQTQSSFSGNGQKNSFAAPPVMPVSSNSGLMMAAQPQNSTSATRQPQQQQNSSFNLKPNDVWNTDLVSLDSLGKQSNSPQTGPALNELAAQKQQGQSQQQMQSSFGQFGGAFGGPNSSAQNPPQKNQNNFDDLLL
ncbi:hypothetical protein MP228_005927 [Amoeboaphelidium protococcarum]|nr:hypothetical protein MP228_005927 [Amoeboaphelidium protococcarum]